MVQVGGQVRLYGLPGPRSMPSWVRLSRTANKNTTAIQVDDDVAGSWPIGGEIAVASSDYDRWQAEKFTIKRGENIASFDKKITLQCVFLGF